MSNKTFTEKEIEILSSNPFVKNVSEKGITYTDEFKRIFVTENESGKSPSEIFAAHGFDVKVLGKHRIRSATKRWRAAYQKEGIPGLKDSRRESSGRLSKKELSLEEEYARLEAQNRLLKAENELLKKLKVMERRLEKNK